MTVFERTRPDLPANSLLADNVTDKCHFYRWSAVQALRLYAQYSLVLLRILQFKIADLLQIGDGSTASDRQEWDLSAGRGQTRPMRSAQRTSVSQAF